MRALIFTMSLVLFAGSSCKKDQERIEKLLTRKNRTWYIANLTRTSTTNGVADYSDSYTNAGTIVFYDHSYRWADKTSIYYTTGGAWSNTSETLTMIKGTDTLDFAIKSFSRRKVELAYQGVSKTDSTTTTYTLDLTLEK